MNIVKLSIDTITRNQFEQIMTIEENCGFDPYTPEMMVNCITNMVTYACLDGRNVAGFITVNPRDRYLDGSLYISNLNVAKSYHRQGIAQKLILCACADCCGADEEKMVTLDVSLDNLPALGLYRKLGFRTIELASRNGSNDVVMAVVLKELINRY